MRDNCLKALHSQRCVLKNLKNDHNNYSHIIIFEITYNKTR